GIVTALDGDKAHSLFHIVVHDIDNALSQRLDGRPLFGPRHTGYLRRHRVCSERHRAAEKEARRQTSKDNVRVGHSQSFTAFCVTNRARHRARAARSYLESATRVE